MWSRLYNALSYRRIDTGIRYPRIKRNRYERSILLQSGGIIIREGIVAGCEHTLDEFAVFAAALWLVSVDAKDVSGSSDHPALSRIAGSTIVVYERKDQAEIRIPLERVVFDLQIQKFNAFKTVSASGRLTRILYAL